MFVNKTKFLQVLKIYTQLSKSYKQFARGKLIYFWGGDDQYLGSVFVPWVPLRVGLSNFSAGWVGVVTLGGSSCFAGVMLVNLVARLAVSRSPSLGCWAAVVRGIFEAGSSFGVKTLS